MNNIIDNNIVSYKKDRVIASMKVEKDKIFSPYLGKTAKLTKGEYTSIEQILDEICPETELEKLDYVIDPTTKHLSLWLPDSEDMTFSSPSLIQIVEWKTVKLVQLSLLSLWKTVKLWSKLLLIFLWTCAQKLEDLFFSLEGEKLF